MPTAQEELAAQTAVAEALHDMRQVEVAYLILPL